MTFRKIAVTALYEIASALCQLADSLAPADDGLWRERRWKQHLQRQARLDAYTVPDDGWDGWRRRSDDE